jgi:dihydrofolate reductase
VDHPEDGLSGEQLAHGAILRADEFRRDAQSEPTTADKGAVMGNIVVSQFVTLDGVFEDPGGAEGFDRGGWAFRFDRGDEGDRFKLDEVMASDALLLGRITYEGFAAAWPSREGEFADRFNGLPKYVVSTTLRDPEWSNSTVIDSDVPARVAELKGRHENDILVSGSGRLVRTLLDEDLVDELRLMVFPILLGAGRRLFADGQESSLRLVDTKPVGPAGVVILTYRPAGD